MIINPNKAPFDSKRFTGYEKMKEKLQILFKLSKKEIEVYFTLLTNEKLTAAELAKITSIQRTRIYEIFRCLKEKGLVELRSETPQEFSAIAPRRAMDTWLFQRRKIFEEESSIGLSLLPTLQGLWNNQHEEYLGSRVTLITEELVREIVPLEVRNAKKHIFLAIRDPNSSISSSKGMFERLFKPKSMINDIQSINRKGVNLQILIGDVDLFIKRSSLLLLKTLVDSTPSKNIVVKSLNMHFPQSFMLVDDIRIYFFFLNSSQDSYNEAIRAESSSLIEFFNITWRMLWDKAEPLKSEIVIEALHKNQK